jgi:PhnB protein
VKDPFGFSWMIATHTKDLSEDEIAKGAQEAFAQMKK